MKDFSYWKVYEGNAEGSGRSEKLWLINPDNDIIGLFKFKKDSATTDHVSECIAYHLATLLEIPCAVFELGTYHGREGSMSYNIVNNPNQTLIEGINYINMFYPEYDAERFIDIASGELYSVQMVQKITQDFFDFSDFLFMLVFDFLIGNSDRHQSNWAVLLESGKTKFSPLYDNGSSLCAFISDDKVNSYLGNDKIRWQSLVDTKSKSLIRRTIHDPKRPTHREMLQYIHDNYFSETVEFIDKIVTRLTAEKIQALLELASEGILSKQKKELIFLFIQAKISILKDVFENKEE